MAAEQRRKPHAIVMSLPYQGHITPFTNLALNIASKGFAVTFVQFEFVHQILSETQNSSFFSEARESGLDIRYATISDGFPLEFDRVLNREEYWKFLLHDFHVLVDEFVGKVIESDSSLASFLVADTLHSWPAAVARKYDLVNVSFWTEPALVFSLNYHLNLLTENGHFPCKDDSDEEINYIPGVDSINTKDLMPYLKEAEIINITPTIVKKTFEAVKNADLILHNTLDEFESLTISALNQNQPNYAIGPISFSPNLPINAASKNLSPWPESDCAEWLNSKPPGSVLYVSFGSLVQVDKEVIQEIAHGLLFSQVNFIWAARAGTADAFPEGFQSEIEDRGLIISWCNQFTVLSNPGIGGFLTHCGWNSVLESIWCGVPMICHPFSFDQPVNRKFVVDDWKIGVNLSDGETVRREEVAENVRKVIGSADSERLREDTRKMKAVLQKAVDVSGSSHASFDRFIEDLKSMIC